MLYRYRVDSRRNSKLGKIMLDLYSKSIVYYKDLKTNNNKEVKVK